MVSKKGSQEPARIVIVDTDPVARRLLAAAFNASASHEAVVRETSSLAEALLSLRDGFRSGAVVSLDLSGGAEAVAALRQAGMNGPILAISKQGSVSAAVSAMRAGADDFVAMPCQPSELARRLFARLPVVEAQEAALAPVSDCVELEGFQNFIGASPAMFGVYEQIKRVAPSKAPVFITGESGTGKEICAEAIHSCSGRANAPFIAINCSAIPKELMESEIFGHVKGAFTGAHEDRPGAAELAHGGTLFLDEICEMDFALQAKLLRFAQTGTLRRVGDTKQKQVDVRFVCATNRDPLREIEAGRFREDLFYRLHVLPLELPSLRERLGDVTLIARAFLSRFAEEEGRGFQGFTPEAEAILESYSWPGNVRELQNIVRRVVVLHDGELVSADMLALPGTATHEAARDTGALPAMSSPSIVPFWQEEQRIIEQALKAFGGNAQKAASALEISPSTIYRKLQAWSEKRA
jgi:two-component system, repressor protein LuxO